MTFGYDFSLSLVLTPTLTNVWSAASEQSLRQQALLLAFVLLSGLFIGLAVWAWLERHAHARLLSKTLKHKIVEDELLDFAPAGYIILWRGGHCHCSDRLRGWFGLTAPVRHIDHLLTQDGKGGLDPNNLNKLKQYVLQIARQRVPYPCLLKKVLGEEEFFVHGKRLQTKDDKDSAVLMWVTRSLATGSVTTIQSPSSHKTTENFELHLEAQADTLNSLSTSVVIFGPDQSLRFCNRAFQKLWGIDEKSIDYISSHGEFLEKMRELRRLPEQADFSSWRRHILSFYTTLKEAREEMWHLPDGTTLRVVTQPYLLGGLIIFFEDVTDRLELERSINTLAAVQKESLDHLHDAVAVIASDGRVTLHNTSFNNLWNLNTETLHDRPHISKVLELCKPLLAAEQRPWEPFKNHILSQITNRVQSAGRWTLTNGKILGYTVVPLPDGATLLTLSDISDSVRVETALRDKNRALETADKLKSEFVSGISSELRAPLNSIIHFAEILDKEYFGTLNDNQKNYLTWILKSSRHVKSFIDDVVDLAVLESGQMHLQMVECDLDHIISSAVAEIKSRTHPKSYSLKVHPDNSHSRIVGDVKQLRHALICILEDIIERISSGAHFSLENKKTGNCNNLIFTFHNTHMLNFWPDNIPNASSSTLKTETEPHYIGLRLALARGIFRAHHGSLVYELRPNDSSTIVCSLDHMPPPPNAELNDVEAESDVPKI